MEEVALVRHCLCSVAAFLESDSNKFEVLILKALALLDSRKYWPFTKKIQSDQISKE
jgi:hypothetical protein